MEGKKNGFFFGPEPDQSQSEHLEQKRFFLSGNFDINRLRESWHYLIKQDPSLFAHHVDIVMHDLSKWDNDHQEQILTKYSCLNHIDLLDQRWWMQFSFFQLTDQQFQLVWTFHHTDQAPRWRACLFFALIFDVYHQSSQYTAIQHSLSWMTEQEVERFWKKQMKDVDVTYLPKFWTTNEEQSSNQPLRIQLSEKYADVFSQWLSNEKISLRSLYQAAWATCLWRYHDQDDLLFAVTNHSGQIFPLRVEMNAEITFFNLLHQIQDRVDQGSLYPFTQRNFSFDHILHISDPICSGDQISLSCMDDFLAYDLTIHINTETIDIHYNEERFSSSQIKRFVMHLQMILEQVYQNPHQLLQNIKIINEGEKQQLIQEFNQTELTLPLQTVDCLISKTASQYQNKAAIVSADWQLTYQELEEKSNQLARKLQHQGLGSGDIIGVMVKNSPWMCVALLGIMKAGAAYLPIDRNYPLKRIAYILKDSGTTCLLIESEVEVPQTYTDQLIYVDQLSLDQLIDTPLTRRHQQCDPAYVIYTSGSTGNPKGVVIPHRALVNLVTWHHSYYQVTVADRSTKYAGFGFDASVWEIFPYLVAGATIYLVPDEIRYDIDELHQYFAQQKITCSFLPTQLAEQFMNQDHPTLRLLLTGGDQLKRIQQRNYLIANNYGPTENTVVTTSEFVEPSQDVISIGKPIANNQIYILNRDQQLQPIGVPGELCVSGESLASGYLNQPELTAERFVRNPFDAEQKMYRTGDIARWLPDGRIEYLGRIDHQVQIRGFRIELSEIESQLLQKEQVKAAVVTARENQQQELSLCAYVVVESTDQIPDIRAALAKELPEYMVPSYWMSIDAIPLTANGKVDLKALPEPQWTRPSEHKMDDQPMSEIEHQLIGLWKEVLGVDLIGAEDHFFQLGGHSLKATMLMTRIRRKWGVKMPITDLFLHPTVREMADLIAGSEMTATADLQPMVTTSTAPYYPASSVQQRLYALQQKKELGTAYHTPMIWLISGKLDLSQLKKTLQSLIDRHESFRTSFCLREGELMQLIHPTVQWEIEYMEASDESAARRQVSDFIRIFQLERAPLFRVGLIDLPDDQHVLVWDMHHTICDGVTTGILHLEFMQIYQGEKLPPLYFQYKDYVIWQQRQLATGQMEDEKGYWLNQFSEDIPSSELATDLPRPIQQQFRGQKMLYTFDDELTRACREFSSDHHVTLYMTLLSVYFVMLSKYTDQESVVVGSALAGRSRQEWESICGMFVNTLPIQASVKQDRSFVNLLTHVKEQVLAAQEHGEYPFAELIADLNLKWDTRRNPLFDTVFISQNMDVPEVQIPGLTIAPFSYEEEHALFDMTWEVLEQNSIQLCIEYNTSLYRQDTIQRMMDHYIHLLKQMIVHPEKKLSLIEMITPHEREQIMTVFNQTAYPVSSELTIVDLLTDQVNRLPDQIAIVDGHRKLTYRQLDEQSNQLARLLRQKGVTSHSIVSILSTPSAELLIGLVAVIKAGGAYLPIDPAYPTERIRYLLEDSRSSLLLTYGVSGGADLFTKEIIDLEPHSWKAELTNALSTQPTSEDLAYVIYTSGSTGNPKGVSVSQRALVNLVTWHNQYYQVTAADRSTKYAGVGFDASVLEIFPYLVAGATIYLIDPSIRHDLYALNRFFEDNQITISFLPTALAESFMELENRSLRTLLVGGDQLHQVKPQTYQIANNYGPTENAVVTSCYTLSSEEVPEKIPIGRPVFNNQVFVVNPKMQLQPIGVPGELCVSGDSLANGYLHRTELTKEKFIDHPFLKGRKMYRTGDLVRWLPDGNLEFMGRIDQQVQIRGYRVELGEIETQLLSMQRVKEAVVVAHQDENKQHVLAAYVSMEENQDEQELRTFLTSRLPEYMIPTYFVIMDTLPHTPNGKVDRRALPKPTGESAIDTIYVAPTTPMQKRLATVWTEVLHVDRIGIHDHFFSLGGDSIKAIQVAARLHQLGYKMTVNDLLEHPTIVELMPFVMEENTKMVERSSEKISGEVPLTPIQQWFLSLDFPDKHHWNQAVMLSSTTGWDVSVVRQSFQELVKHHDVLRMNYVEKDKEIKQVIQADLEQMNDYFTVDLFTLDSEEGVEARIQQEANRLHQTIDLVQGPLMRVALFQSSKKDYLLIMIHHLVIDGVSWRILLEDFQQAYNALLHGEALVLSPKTHSFQLWSNQLQEYANSPALLNELPYWRNMDEQDVLKLTPSQGQKLDYLLQDSELIEYVLTQQQTAQLLSDVHHAYRTEINDLLLTALGYALREWCKASRIAVNMEGHGRESIIEGMNITRTVGWFTSSFPVVLDISFTDLPTMIKTVKETLRQVPNKGIGYGILRYLTDDALKEGLMFRLRPEISFNYLGQFDQAVLFAGMGSNAQSLGESFSMTSPMHPIEVVGMVVEEQLQFCFRFHRLTFRREQIQRLVDLFQHFLLQLSDHCLSQEESTWTPSDFSANDVSLEELDQFLERLD